MVWYHELNAFFFFSGFIFLRWICPAIISPKQFGLVQGKLIHGYLAVFYTDTHTHTHTYISIDHPDTKTCRTLTLIAKCLMTLASHSSIEQNAKEPWMVRLNEFVQVRYYKSTFFYRFY